MGDRVDLTAVEQMHVDGASAYFTTVCESCGYAAMEEAQRWTDSGGEAGQLLHNAAVEVDALVDFDGGES